ncbi:ornithine cyclodeaminase [Acidiplasma sp.]|jgi:alanine dehydrogenase
MKNQLIIMIYYISDEDVKKYLDIKECINELRDAFTSYGNKKSYANARDRIYGDNFILNTMPAYYEKYNIAGLKTYISGKNGVRFVVIIFDISDPEKLFIIDANTLGQIRTGALTAMVTSLLINKKNINYTLIGSGFQAETQLKAMASIYDLNNVYVYSKNYEHALNFSKKFDFNIKASRDLSVLKDSDVITSVTNSKTPIFDYSMLPEKYHINLVGSNIIGRREANNDVLDNSDIVISENLDQSMKEASEIIDMKNKNKIVELKDFIINVNKYKVNKSVFKSMGIGLEDIAAGYIVLKNMKVI